MISPNRGTNRFQSTYWGTLKHFEVPTSIVQATSIDQKETKIHLRNPALSVLLVILQSAQARKSQEVGSPVIVKMKSTTLSERTRYSKDKITQATRELDCVYLKRIENIKRKKHGRFGSSEFVLLNPTDSSEFKWGATRNLHYAAGIPYFLFPQCVITDTSAPWSLACMSPCEFRLYVAICWRANRSRGSLFEVAEKEVAELSGLSRPAFRKALTRIEELGLIEVERVFRELKIALCDPFTREPLHQKEAEADTRKDLENYKAVDSHGRAKRMNFNTADPEMSRRLLEQSLPANAQMVPQNNGDVFIGCPYHSEDTPSCSVSFVSSASDALVVLRREHSVSC
jgi:DNA-binding transcriptional ArsR family regulator